MRPGLRAVWSATRGALALLALAAIWLARPAYPHLSGSLTAPVSASELEQVVRWLAWLLAAFLILAVFVRTLRGVRRSRATRKRIGLAGVLPGKPAAVRPCASRSPRTAFALTIPSPPIATGSTPHAARQGEPASVIESEAPADDAAPAISIAVLGPLAIDGIERRIKRAATRELLAYLAFHPQGGSRDELIEAIWPAQDPKRTRPRFWQSVTEARKAIGDAWIHHGERYKLDRSKVRVDLDELDRLLTVTGDDESDPATLETALALWRGEPLDGADYLWADGEIRNLRATLVDLLDRVGRLRLGRDDARGALQIAEQAITLDGLHEPSWRLALEAEHALGLRESITRRYADLSRSLDEQLGLEPTRETRVIYRRLLGQT
ncbi:MAG: AfsR/SARP family transcriptional regulator [Solirubrobacteraceae bacterium]